MGGNIIRFTIFVGIVGLVSIWWEVLKSPDVLYKIIIGSTTFFVFCALFYKTIWFCFTWFFKDLFSIEARDWWRKKFKISRNYKNYLEQREIEWECNIFDIEAALENEHSDKIKIALNDDLLFAQKMLDCIKDQAIKEIQPNALDPLDRLRDFEECMYLAFIITNDSILALLESSDIDIERRKRLEKRQRKLLEPFKKSIRAHYLKKNKNKEKP